MMKESDVNWIFLYQASWDHFSTYEQVKNTLLTSDSSPGLVICHNKTISFMSSFHICRQYTLSVVLGRAWIINNSQKNQEISILTSKKGRAEWTKVPVSHLFGDHEEQHVWSQLCHQLHQLPTVGTGQCTH
jgi:hypothetical protein